MMGEHQRETAFLRQCILYDESPERQDLEDRIIQLQRDESCVRRAGWLMVVLSGLAFVSLGYSAVFLDDFPLRMSGFVTRLIVRGCFVLGSGSLVCLVVFVCLRVAYRMKLDQHREECRQLVRKLLESRLGKPAARLLQNEPANRVDTAHGRTMPVASEVNGSPASTQTTARS